MTRERIKEIQEVIVPYFVRQLKKLNYEGLGEADAEEAEKDLNEVFGMAIKALEQEPFKPMVEIDLDYVIKQKYIEREVLNKIRAEIKELPTYYHEIRRPNSVVLRDMVVADEVLQIIDKYKAETEEV